MSLKYDLIIKNAAVIDGTGAKTYNADVAILDDKITAIGSLNEFESRRLIDASGFVLAPGFIDVHTHDDTNVIRTPNMLSKISQGVTSVIVGNCGISASPVTLGGDPPDPMNLLGGRQDFIYPTFKHYVAAVEQVQPRVNVAALVGHTALRSNHLKDIFQPASESEIAVMSEQLNQAMSQGALGLSSGLAYASAKQAPMAEVKALVKELAKHNGIYSTHMRTEFDAIIDAMNEAFETAEYGKVPLIISHLKCAGAGNWGRTTETLTLLEEKSKTQKVACDCYPYSASSSTLDLKQVTSDFDIYITWSDSEPDMAGKLLAEIAELWNLSLIDAAKRLQPAGAVYHGLHPDDVKRVLKYKHTMIGSDGLPNDPHPHPRLWGTFPRVLGFYSREEALFELPEAVHKMTGLSASEYHLANRGEIQIGNYADLVLFNAKTIRDKATFEDPIQKSLGIEKVWVNGQLSYHKGQITETRHGRFLRRVQQ
ncbi:N-acyl-D-amino-acid deacylase family protein [Psychromonas aquimarina]|uniref:N-acyl-D-amino-acid deacylase family protein n=1 Tax=Psychromonas aquimarina TaxID=444919 RepID=UPI00040BE823|nr:D-aminoacylase [Psychromonas aquimarina]